MAIFSKPIDKGIPAILRRQSVDSTEISSGDIIDVKTLLGNSAARSMHVTTSSGSDVSVRYNVIRKVYPQRQPADGFGTAADLPYKHIGNEVIHIDQTMDPIPLPADHKSEHAELGPIESIEVTWTSGTWTFEFFA
jgi:hypothetical protein